MKRRSVLLALTGVSLLLMAVGCAGGSTGGRAEPSNVSSMTSSSASDPNGEIPNLPKVAPKVTSPLDAAKFVKQPCSALAAGNLPELTLGGAQTTATDAAGNPGCDWQVNPPGSTDGVVWMTSQPTGLGSVYALGALKGGYFQPTTIDGYPAVYNDDADLRTGGDCGLSVGISDTLYFDILFELTTDHNSKQYATESCLLAERTASDVIKNLRGNGG